MILRYCDTAFAGFNHQRLRELQNRYESNPEPLAWWLELVSCDKVLNHLHISVKCDIATSTRLLVRLLGSVLLKCS